MKLEMHPVSATSFSELIARAAIGPIDGTFVAGGVALLTLASMAIAVTGPSEQMRDWTEPPSPIVRLRSLRVPGWGKADSSEPRTKGARLSAGG